MPMNMMLVICLLMRVYAHFGPPMPYDFGLFYRGLSYDNDLTTYDMGQESMIVAIANRYDDPRIHMR